MELKLPLETLAWIIVKAREVNVKDADTSDGAEYDDGDASVLEDRGGDPSEDELRSWIADMTDSEQAELVALYWLGRGDGDAEEFEELVATARAAREGPTEDYLLGAPLLADLLEEGMEKMGLDVAEIESRI
ncbi:DUF3775 domain-containing protein [Rhodovulum sp. DZ06]|uniref:DUF3775 domain-containing protein n=1 Tax=Rhodovulum sp. DZ06 TaxID=3425126 RepID=UPI003D358471